MGLFSQEDSAKAMVKRLNDSGYPAKADAARRAYGGDQRQRAAGWLDWTKRVAPRSAKPASA